MGSHSVTCHPSRANAPRLNPSHAGWYSTYLPRRDGRLSWPSWLDSAPAGSRTSDLSITSPTPNRCTMHQDNRLDEQFFFRKLSNYFSGNGLALPHDKKMAGTPMSANQIVEGCEAEEMNFKLWFVRLLLAFTDIIVFLRRTHRVATISTNTRFIRKQPQKYTIKAIKLGAEMI